MSSNAPIGILDSGLGGLTVWREIIRLMPCESTVYYADTANCPYGGRSYPEIIELADRCVNELMNRGVKIIVIACNTITAASITLLREQYPEMIFVGMEPAIKPASEITKTGIVGILATKATLAGELYHKTSSKLERDIEIIETAGEGLVEMVESGMENSIECETLTRKYIQPMIAQGADCVVLGCTHYPILSETINRISQGKLTIINPAPAVSRRVRSLLMDHNKLTSHDCEKEVSINEILSQRHIFISSAGDEASERVRQKAMELISVSEL